jgi:hypothetical protein
LTATVGNMEKCPPSQRKAMDTQMVYNIALERR